MKSPGALFVNVVTAEDGWRVQMICKECGQNVIIVLLIATWKHLENCCHPFNYEKRPKPVAAY